uniref:EXPERA domain-containing protein n=1 Tax=Oryza glumipatula TaxID=40148 RepID=A0A0D9ZB23_9ORYZ
MGFVTAAADAVVALLSLTMAVAAPLFDAQVVLPRGLYPAPLVGIHRWFAAEFGHYLVADPPPFFRGLVWLDLAFLCRSASPTSTASSRAAPVCNLRRDAGFRKNNTEADSAFCVVSAHAQHRLLLLHLMPQLLGRKGSRSDEYREIPKEVPIIVTSWIRYEDGCHAQCQGWWCNMGAGTFRWIGSFHGHGHHT